MSLRKKFCLKLPAIFTDETERRPIGGYSSGRVILAAAAHTEYGENGYDILVIDLFSEEGPLVGRYFADVVTCEHKGWNVEKKKWFQKIRLDNLVSDITSMPKDYQHYGWRDDPYCLREGDEEVIYNYIGSELSAWENVAESELTYKRANRHEELVQQRVNGFWRPAEPDFKEWAGELARKKVVICQKSEDKKETKCTCTCCGKSWVRKKYYRTSQEIACPECGKMVAPVRFSSHLIRYTNGENVYLIAPGKDRTSWYLEMRWACGVFNIAEGQWEETHIRPYIMVRLEPQEHFGQCYYYFPNAGWSDRAHGSNIMFENGILYPNFGEAEEYMDEGQVRLLNAIGRTGLVCNVDHAVMKGESQHLEYVIKRGFKKFSRQLIDEYYKGTDAKTADEFFGFNRQRQNRLLQMDGGRREAEWLRWEEKTGKKITDEDLNWYVGHGVGPDGNGWYGSGWNELLSLLGSPRKARNYIEKQAAQEKVTVVSAASDYADYIDMAKKLRCDLGNSLICKPRDLKKSHDIFANLLRTKALEIKAENIADKFPKVHEILQSIQDKYTYKGEDFQIIAPNGIVDILREGSALGHCVDTSDRYFERIEQRTTYLVFLRKNENPGQPYYTLEIQPSGTVRQQRTTGNVKKEEDVEAYKPFILEWQKEVRKRLTAEDKELDRKSDEIRVEEYQDLRDRKEPIRSGILAGTLLVDALEGDLIMSTAG